MIANANTVIDGTVEYATFEEYEGGKYILRTFWYDRDYIYERLVYEMKRKYIDGCKGITVHSHTCYDGFYIISFVEADDFGKSRLTFHVRKS